MTVSSLSNLVAPTAQRIAEQVDLSPQAHRLLARGLSSSDYVKALAKQGLNSDAVGFLANGLKEQQGVQWAAESARLVSDQLPPEEVNALEAAAAWAKGHAMEGDVQGALSETQFAGPGSWAAQAALWAATGLDFASAADGPAIKLAPKAIDGAVRLAAAVKADAWSPPTQGPQGDPDTGLTAAASQAGAAASDAVGAPLSSEDVAAANNVLKPFVDLGLRIAEGS